MALRVDGNSLRGSSSRLLSQYIEGEGSPQNRKWGDVDSNLRRLRRCEISLWENREWERTWHS